MLFKKIQNSLSENRGASILGFIVVAPFLVWFFLYLVLGGSFFLDKNDMITIVNSKFDSALVEGQFTMDLKQELVDELEAEGFDQSDLVIEVTPAECFDNDNGTYAPRGTEIKMIIYYEKVHPFYYINFGVGNEERFYPGTKITGMSEKW